MTTRFQWRGYTIEIEFTATYDPGNTSGPPESCSPPEGEITSMEFWHEDPLVKATFEKEYNDDPTGTLQAEVDAKCWEGFGESSYDDWD